MPLDTLDTDLPPQGGHSTTRTLSSPAGPTRDRRGVLQSPTAAALESPQDRARGGIPGRTTPAHALPETSTLDPWVRKFLENEARSHPGAGTAARRVEFRLGNGEPGLPEQKEPKLQVQPEGMVMTTPRRVTHCVPCERPKLETQMGSEGHTHGERDYKLCKTCMDVNGVLPPPLHRVLERGTEVEGAQLLFRPGTPGWESRAQEISPASRSHTQIASGGDTYTTYAYSEVQTRRTFDPQTNVLRRMDTPEAQEGFTFAPRTGTYERVEAGVDLNGFLRPFTRTPDEIDKRSARDDDHFDGIEGDRVLRVSDFKDARVESFELPSGAHIEVIHSDPAFTLGAGRGIYGDPSTGAPADPEVLTMHSEALHEDHQWNLAQMRNYRFALEQTRHIQNPEFKREAQERILDALGPRALERRLQNEPMSPEMRARMEDSLLRAEHRNLFRDPGHQSLTSGAIRIDEQGRIDVGLAPTPGASRGVWHSNIDEASIPGANELSLHNHRLSDFLKQQGMTLREFETNYGKLNPGREIGNHHNDTSIHTRIAGSERTELLHARMAGQLESRIKETGIPKEDRERLEDGIARLQTSSSPGTGPSRIQISEADQQSLNRYDIEATTRGIDLSTRSATPNPETLRTAFEEYRTPVATEPVTLLPKAEVPTGFLALAQQFEHREALSEKLHTANREIEGLTNTISGLERGERTLEAARNQFRRDLAGTVTEPEKVLALIDGTATPGARHEILQELRTAPDAVAARAGTQLREDRAPGMTGMMRTTDGPARIGAQMASASGQIYHHNLTSQNTLLDRAEQQIRRLGGEVSSRSTPAVREAARNVGENLVKERSTARQELKEIGRPTISRAELTAQWDALSPGAQRLAVEKMPSLTSTLGVAGSQGAPGISSSARSKDFGASVPKARSLTANKAGIQM